MLVGPSADGGCITFLVGTRPRTRILGGMPQPFLIPIHNKPDFAAFLWQTFTKPFLGYGQLSTRRPKLETQNPKPGEPHHDILILSSTVMGSLTTPLSMLLPQALHRSLRWYQPFGPAPKRRSGGSLASRKSRYPSGTVLFYPFYLGPPS